MLADASTAAILALASDALVLAEGRPAALPALAPDALVLADGRPAAILALAPDALVLADGSPTAILAVVLLPLVRAQLPLLARSLHPLCQSTASVLFSPHPLATSRVTVGVGSSDCKSRPACIESRGNIAAIKFEGHYDKSIMYASLGFSRFPLD